MKKAICLILALLCFSLHAVCEETALTTVYSFEEMGAPVAALCAYAEVQRDALLEEYLLFLKDEVNLSALEDVGFEHCKDTIRVMNGQQPKSMVVMVAKESMERQADVMDYSEEMSLPAAESEALRLIAKVAGEDGVLTPDELSGVEGIEQVACREVRMALDASKLEQVVYDGVEETKFEMNGCEVNILDFHMTHLGASIRLRVTAPAGMTEEEGMRMAYSVVSPMEDDHGNGYSWCLFRPDGSMLALEEGWSGGAGYGLSPDGRASYGFHLDIDSIIPLEGLEKLVLMPYRMHYDDHDQPVYDYLKDWAVELTPILSKAQGTAEPVQTLSPEEQTAFDRFMNGEVTTRLERQTAAANWQAGDPTITVYATEKGKYFHVDIDCSGMRNAFPWAIEDAVKDGKLPCPDCVGGPNAPEKVDIMNNEFYFPDDD